MLVDLVTVYKATSMYSKLHCDKAISREATTATTPILPRTCDQPEE